jgi:hypothetical protein
MAFKLLTSQKNQIFELVQLRGFQPSEFQWQDFSLPAGTVPRLLHLPSGFWISFEWFELKGFYATYSPAEEIYQMERNPGNWGGVVSLTSEWLLYLKRETEVPDLWDNLPSEMQLIQEADQQPSDNLPFTQAELPQVRDALEEIKSYVLKTHALSEEQKGIVDARFDYMEETATRLGRKDWTNIVVSNLLSIVITLSLSGDSTKDLFRFAGQVVKRLLGATLYLAGPH